MLTLILWILGVYQGSSKNNTDTQGHSSRWNGCNNHRQICYEPGDLSSIPGMLWFENGVLLGSREFQWSFFQLTSGISDREMFVESLQAKHLPHLIVLIEQCLRHLGTWKSHACFGKVSLMGFGGRLKHDLANKSLGLKILCWSHHDMTSTFWKHGFKLWKECLV